MQVGRQMFVCISRIDEEKNDLIISEKEAWVCSPLQTFLSFFMSLLEKFCDQSENAGCGSTFFSF